ncbi:MAG: LiaF transmembrane domain-containing protein [Eubacteriales bacterium]
MKKLTKILWGIVLVLAGGIFALNACGVTDIDVFFDGWWTLFIIIPCLVGIFTEKEKTANLIGLAVGVVLLLCCQKILSFGMIWKLLVPIVIVIIGLRLILGAIFGDKVTKMLAKSRKNDDGFKESCAIFSGRDENFEGEHFDGAELTAVFGGVKCDLRNAVIDNDCAVEATAIFGGIDIFVPDNINLKVRSNSIFGGVSGKKHRPFIEGAPTLYINASGIFGGVDIK